MISYAHIDSHYNSDKPMKKKQENEKTQCI